MMSNWCLTLLSSGNHIKSVCPLNPACLLGRILETSLKTATLIMTWWCTCCVWIWGSACRALKEVSLVQRSLCISTALSEVLWNFTENQNLRTGEWYVETLCKFPPPSEVNQNVWQRHSLGRENESFIYSGNSQHCMDFCSLVFIALPRTSQPCFLVLTQIICS